MRPSPGANEPSIVIKKPHSPRAEPLMSLLQRAATQVDAEGYFIDAEGDRVDDLDQFSDLDSE